MQWARAGCEGTRFMETHRTAARHASAAALGEREARCAALTLPRGRSRCARPPEALRQLGVPGFDFR